MKKIPTMFKREGHKIIDVQHPDCGWVFDGEGIATRKIDGTCCMIKDGQFFKRREIKKDKFAPDNFIQEDYDTITGKTFGWMPVEPTDKWHLEAFKDKKSFEDGTYELVGPKVQGNPEKYKDHTLINHKDTEQFLDVPRTLIGLKEWFKEHDIEGIVFHHPDGRMAKIKKKEVK